jgi:hypothetical protein
MFSLDNVFPSIKNPKISYRGKCLLRKRNYGICASVHPIRYAQPPSPPLNSPSPISTVAPSPSELSRSLPLLLRPIRARPALVQW